MSEENILSQIKSEADRMRKDADKVMSERLACSKIEKRIRNILYGIIIAFGGLAITAFSNNILTQRTVIQQGEYIEIIRKNYITYETFIESLVLLNRTYEMQISHFQAMYNGTSEDVKIAQENYNELRTLIVTRRFNTRSGGKKK